MKKRFFSLLFILFATSSFFSFQSIAQKALDDMLTKLEKSEDVNMSVVSKRDPDTKKITKIIKSVTIPSGKEGDKILEQIYKAFEQEEDHATEIIKNRKGKKYESILLKYKKDGKSYMYSLSGKVFTLIAKSTD